MKRWCLEVACGVAVGFLTRVTLPGHHPGSYVAAILLSLLGAAGGSVLAETALTEDLLPAGGVVLAAMGAIAALLIQALL